MQRPDQDYSPRLDPTRTTLSGYTQTLNFNRVSGRHWLFGVSSIYDTVAFEANQIGQMNGADGIQPGASITYRETQPGRIFRNYSIRLSQSNEWNHGWNRQTGSIQSTINLMWVNFWTSSLSISQTLRGADARLTRGGPLMGTPHGWNLSGTFGNSATAQTRWTGGAGASENELGGKTRRINGIFRVPARAALATVGCAVLRSHYGCATVCLNANRRQARDVRQPLRLFLHRAKHVRRRASHGFHAEAGCESSMSTPSRSRPRDATTTTASCDAQPAWSGSNTANPARPSRDRA